MHGHSHFAFSGWVSQALMAIIVARLSGISGKDLFGKYNRLLYLNLICAYGMLISFPIQGYGVVSIFFSTCALFVSYFFMASVWADTNKCRGGKIIIPWLKAATLFNALSSIGAFSLAFMMATRCMQQNWYLAAMYFFLHFQYNGWFSFVLLGLLFEKLELVNVSSTILKKIFWLFAIAFFPAYFLSALWMPIPFIVYIMVVISAIMQMVGWIWAMMIIWGKRKLLKTDLSGVPGIIIALSLLAFTVKLVLQLGSTIPSLSTLAYGFRPIVIGYLHLVFLGFVTLFIIGYSMNAGKIETDKKNTRGVFILIAGIIMNEIALMVQGISALSYVVVPFINEILFGIAIIIFTGVFIINIHRGDLRL